jgi:hypothetical protein
MTDTSNSGFRTERDSLGEMPCGYPGSATGW